MAAATFSLTKGEDLDKDPVYLKQMEDPEFRKEAAGAKEEDSETVLKATAGHGLLIFLHGILAVSTLALISKTLLPQGVGMSGVI